MRTALRALVSVALLSSLALAQGASEALEAEARKAFRAGRYKDAAIKFQDAAAAASDPTRRARMEVQSAWSHFNLRDPRAAREAARRAFVSDANLEIVPDFFSPEFVALVAESRRAAKAASPGPGAELGELKRTSLEKIHDGRAADVVYDITNVPSEKRDAELWEILAKAYDAIGRPDQAAAARRGSTAPAGSAPAGTTASVPAAPTPWVPPAPSTPLPRGNDSSPADLLMAGRQALVRGDSFAAQSSANRLLELQPESSEAYRLLGDAFRARGENAMAEANWRQALRYDDRNESTLLTLADFFQTQQNWDSALEFLRKAVSVNPSNGSRLVALGRKLRNDNDLPRARQVFASAASAMPGDPAVLTEYASVLLLANDPDAALDPLTKATAADPRRAAAHANLAAVLRRKGNVKDAEREYREALRLEPDMSAALQGLGVLLLGAGRASEAKEPLRAAVEKNPRDAGAVLAHARALRVAGDLAGAAASLESAGSDDAAVLNEAGAVAYERGRYDDAAKLFERAWQKDTTLAVAKTNFEKAKSAAQVLAAIAPATAPAATAPAKK